MAMIGPENSFRAKLIRPADGVSPPSAMPEFSSMRSTPADAASSISSIPPAHSSRTGRRVDVNSVMLQIHAMVTFNNANEVNRSNPIHLEAVRSGDSTSSDRRGPIRPCRKLCCRCSSVHCRHGAFELPRPLQPVSDRFEGHTPSSNRSRRRPSGLRRSASS